MMHYRNDVDLAFGLGGSGVGGFGVLDSIPSDADIAAAQARWQADFNTAVGGLESRYGSTVNQWAGSVRAGVDLAQSIADGKNWQGTPEEAKAKVADYAQQACATLGTVSSALQTACEATMTVLNAIAGWIVDAYPAVGVGPNTVAYNYAALRTGYSGGAVGTRGYDAGVRRMLGAGWAVFFYSRLPATVREQRYWDEAMFGIYVGSDRAGDFAKITAEMREIDALPNAAVAIADGKAPVGSPGKRLADFDRWFRAKWLMGRERIASLVGAGAYLTARNWISVPGASTQEALWYAVKWDSLPAEVRRNVYANLVAEVPDTRGDQLAGAVLSMARIGMQPRQIEAEFLTYILANKPVPTLDIRRAGPGTQLVPAPGPLYKNTEKSEGLGSGSKIGLALAAVGVAGLGLWLWSRRSAGLSGLGAAERHQFRDSTMIRQIVSRLHVGTPDDEAVEYVRGRLKKGAWATLSAKEKADFEAEVRRAHAANRRLYREVMRSR